MRLTLFLLLATFVSSPMAMACSRDTDCLLGDRTYRIALPPQHDGGTIGAVVYAHGYRGSAKGAMRNQALVDFAHSQGMALVAVKSADIDWMIPGVPKDPGADGRIEFEYFDRVVADLALRHGIDTDNLVATGFSAGGMMVWNLACHRGRLFRAFVPVAGTFWQPVPQQCETYPVDLVHVHGRTDRIVPLSGRPIGQTHQGDVPTALARLTSAGSYQPTASTSEGDLTCTVSRSAADRILSYCEHPGGHAFKIAHLRTALQILRDRGVLNPR